MRSGEHAGEPPGESAFCPPRKAISVSVPPTWCPTELELNAAYRAFHADQLWTRRWIIRMLNPPQALKLFDNSPRLGNCVLESI
jgi:hypothetical protein